MEENISTIDIKESHNLTTNISDINYVKDIMVRIEPLETAEPIIVAKKWSDYFVIDGYHRLKNALMNNKTSIDCIVLDNYKINRKNDSLFDFLSSLKGQKIKFIDDTTLIIDNVYYKIDENEGCGGCSNGWSSIKVLPKFFNKDIKINKIYSVDTGYDTYDLYINNVVIANVNTGYGNGYYGGDFSVKVLP